jgi:hypothetical protein
MSNELAIVEDAVIAMELSREIAGVGVPADRVPGAALLVRAAFAVDTSTGLARLVAKSGRPVADELRERLTAPVLAPLVGPLAGQVAPVAEPAPLSADAPWHEKAFELAREQQKIFYGTAAPYDPGRSVREFEAARPAAPASPDLPMRGGLPHAITWESSTGPPRNF